LLLGEDYIELWEVSERSTPGLESGSQATTLRTTEPSTLGK